MKSGVKGGVQETPLQKRGRRVSEEYGLSRPVLTPMDYAAKRVKCMLAQLHRQIDSTLPSFRRVLFSQAPLPEADVSSELLIILDTVLTLMSDLELNQDESAILEYLKKQISKSKATSKVVPIKQAQRKERKAG